MKGIDVSRYQRAVDYKKLKAAGVEFVIIQAGFGDVISYPTQKDTMFESHYSAAKAAGLHVGAYWYSYATTPERAKREAQGFVQTIKGKQFDMPVFIDLEEKSQFATGKVNCSAIVKAFCDVLENAGYWSGLYISRSYLQTYITSDIANRYSLWIAEYASKCNYSGTIDIWQYTSTARYNGYNGNLDGDICYKDYPTLIKDAGKNGYPKIALKVLDTTGFKRGNKTIGVLALKEMLLAAYEKKLVSIKVLEDNGYGEGTEKAVNELLKKWNYKQNGIAGENFIKRLAKSLK